MRPNLSSWTLLGCTLVALGLAGSAPPQSAPSRPTTILVVRHADRDGERDALTALGEARARELVHVAAKAGVSAVYCTRTVRSRKTAEPLATARSLTPIDDPMEPDALVRHVLANHRGKTVVVVGHSNTVAKIVAAAGGPTIPDLAETDFDDLYVVTVGGGSPAEVSLATLQYGAATP